MSVTPTERELLTELRDRDEISRLILTYAHGLDTGDWDTVRGCFTDDAVIEGSVDTLPIDDVLARSNRLTGTYAANMHVVGNQMIDLDGDIAWVHSYVVAYHWKATPAGTDDPDNLIAGGRYHDTVRRTESGWRISHRQVSRDWNVGRQPTM
ncbi:nuclear transport factor 2 family protein [Kribbella kalugense]|uniref:SnoaL-like protein n=1 Tax=Kribbella kalugense TaxID=2512221 RepID=A0A4R8A1Y5_9ACTN|nr:nuclear transport factor 2 family protein [Kribbella kalugense]TDW24215.1 SnoaL-like protein [Kribbella kalugense]